MVDIFHDASTHGEPSFRAGWRLVVLEVGLAAFTAVTVRQGRTLSARPNQL